MRVPWKTRAPVTPIVTVAATGTVSARSSGPIRGSRPTRMITRALARRAASAVIPRWTAWNAAKSGATAGQGTSAANPFHAGRENAQSTACPPTMITTAAPAHARAASPSRRPPGYISTPIPIAVKNTDWANTDTAGPAPAFHAADHVTAQAAAATTNAVPVRRPLRPAASSPPATANPPQQARVTAAAAGSPRQYGQPAASAPAATAAPAPTARRIRAPSHRGGRKGTGPPAAP